MNKNLLGMYLIIHARNLVFMVARETTALLPSERNGLSNRRRHLPVDGRDSFLEQRRFCQLPSMDVRNPLTHENTVTLMQKTESKSPPKGR